MRTYQEARALIGQRLKASSTNGRTRWVKFEEIVGGVAVSMFHTDIVKFYPTHVEIYTEGFVTPSTFDGIATALGMSRSVVGTVKREPFLLGCRMTEGMRLDYDGVICGAGGERTPLAPPRKRRAS